MRRSGGRVEVEDADVRQVYQTPFEALRDYEEDDAPNTVTQLEEQVIPTQSYQRKLEEQSMAKLQERQEPTLREKIITRLKSRVPKRRAEDAPPQGHEPKQDEGNHHSEVAKLKLQMPEDIQHPTLDVKKVAIKVAAVGNRVKIETRRFDAPQPELDASGNEVEPDSKG